MISNLIFCLNATIPIFLLMLLGMFLRMVGVLTEELASGLNKVVFKVAIPAFMFRDMVEISFENGLDWKFILMCFATTAGSILVAVLLSMILTKKGTRAEFVQVSYRSSAALLGIALIESIYDSSKMVPLMIVGSVPLYNVAAVLVLTLMNPDQRPGMGKEIYKKLVIDIITNPIILGIGFGFVWSFIKLPIPRIMGKTIGYLAPIATPLGLMALGASFQVGETLEEWKLVLAAVFLKLVGFAAVIVPIAVWMGFTRDRLLSILVMTASPSTVSCFVMARNMGYKGNLTASVVLVTTILGSFTLTVWLFVLKTIGLF